MAKIKKRAKINSHAVFRRSKEWRDFRLEFLKDRNKCECCGAKRSLQVHHIFPEEYTNLDPKRFAALCSICHNAVSVLERMKEPTFNSLNNDYKLLFGKFVGKFI